MPPGNPAAPSFLIDENLPHTLATRLIEAGYVADHILGLGLRGSTDQEVFRFAQQRGSVIVTSDVGFGDIRQYPPPHGGLIVARLPDTLPIARRVEIILTGIAAVANEPLQNKVVTVEVGRVRIRH